MVALVAAMYWYTPWGVQAADLAADPFDVPSDWEEVTEAQYNSRLAIIQADPGAWKANIANQQCQARKDAFQDLHSTIPALDLETCYILSQWRPGDC